MTPSLSATSPGNLVKYITHTDLYKALDEAAIQDIEAELEWIHLGERETLFQHGQEGNSLYIVVAGQLGVVITQPDGTSNTTDDLTPGAIVGEMGLFTGQTPITAIYAVKETNLVKLSKDGFDRLVDKHPEVSIRFSQLMFPRLREVQLASAFNKLFGDFSEAALAYLVPELEWLHIYNGDVLVRQGDIDDSLYIVISGRLSVVVQGEDGSQKMLAEISRGESIGELALLTGEPRSATVCAIRDTVVVRLTKPSFDRLIEKHPQVITQITRLIVERHQRSLSAFLPATKKIATIAIIPAGQDAPFSEFAQQIATALDTSAPTLHLNSTYFDDLLGKAGAAQTSRAHPTSLALETWLSEQETIYRYIIYEADSDWTTWTRRCIRNADLILMVGQADRDPKLSKIERSMLQIDPGYEDSELVLLHAETTDRPRNTHKWLARRRVHAHHHLRLNHKEDLQRLIRRLTGSMVGLVLSGGGARAFAHIGAIRAIQEAGLPIDLVGGSSLGSIVAAAYALGWDYSTMVKAAATFFSPTTLFDYTLPLVAFTNSKKMTRILAHEFRDIQIEDLWLPYFCISTNLTRAKSVIHRQGALWRSLRASCSLPGIFTPVVEKGELLVDGAILNNLPVDIMYELCQGGPVIAVDVSAETDLTDDYHFSASLSGWQVLWSRLNPLIPEIKAPSIMDTLRRSTELNSIRQKQTNQALVDIFINPSVSQFGLTAFDAYETLIEIGYQAAKEAITAWLNNQQAELDIVSSPSGQH